MKPDRSWQLYTEYYKRNAPVIKITMKDGAVLKGVFTGFFRGDEKNGEMYITAWKLDNNINECPIGLAPGRGIRVQQNEISMVSFCEDGYTMQFGNQK